jgi:hypothetical protein
MRGSAYSANSGAFQLVETAPSGLLCVKSSRHWKWLKKYRYIPNVLSFCEVKREPGPIVHSKYSKHPLFEKNVAKLLEFDSFNLPDSTYCYYRSNESVY